MSAEDEPITLDDLVVLAQRFPHEEDPASYDRGSDWALIDADDNVIGCFQTEEEMLTNFYSRVLADPADGLGNQAVRIAPGGRVDVLWPSPEAELERAQDFAQRLGWARILPGELDRIIMRDFLCCRVGEVRFADETTHVVELYWWDPLGKRTVVGYLWRQPPGDGWEVLTSRWTLSRPDIAMSRIAETLSDELERFSYPIDTGRVQIVRTELHRGKASSGLVDALIKAALLITESLGVLDRYERDLE